MNLITQSAILVALTFIHVLNSQLQVTRMHCDCYVASTVAHTVLVLNRHWSFHVSSQDGRLTDEQLLFHLLATYSTSYACGGYGRMRRVAWLLHNPWLACGCNVAPSDPSVMGH
jgi:hypothetical protein